MYHLHILQEDKSLECIESETTFVKTKRNNEWNVNFLCHPIYQPLRSGRIWHKVNF